MGRQQIISMPRERVRHTYTTPNNTIFSLSFLCWRLPHKTICFLRCEFIRRKSLQRWCDTRSCHENVQTEPKCRCLARGIGNSRICWSKDTRDPKNFVRKLNRIEMQSTTKIFKDSGKSLRNCVS